MSSRRVFRVTDIALCACALIESAVQNSQRPLFQTVLVYTLEGTHGRQPAGKGLWLVGQSVYLLFVWLAVGLVTGCHKQHTTLSSPSLFLRSFLLFFGDGSSLP